MKLPLYHEMIALGVPEETAMDWHSSIDLLRTHADNMMEAIEKCSETGNISYAVRAACIYKELKG